MKKLLFISAAVILFLSGCGQRQIYQNNAVPVSDKSYTNNALGYSIEYPGNWVVEDSLPDALNNDVRIHPINPDLLPVAPTSTANYIHIRLENQPLDTMRKIFGSHVGGNDMVESKITFAGQNAYFYSHPDFLNPGETLPTVVFRTILLEHNGKVISIFTHKYQLAEVKKVLESFKFIGSPSAANTTAANTVVVPELSMKLELPAGYTMGEDVNKGMDANFGSYSFDSHEKQGVAPTIQRLSFYSEASIKKFTKDNCADTEDWEGNPCANGGYPGLENYLNEKKAFDEQKANYKDAKLKKFNGRNFYSRKARCNGDSCELYYYTTYIGSTKVDFSLISWDNDGQKMADELFEKIKIMNTTKN